MKTINLILISVALGFALAWWWMQKDVALTQKERARLAKHDTEDAKRKAFIQKGLQGFAEREAQMTTEQRINRAMNMAALDLELEDDEEMDNA